MAKFIRTSPLSFFNYNSIILFLICCCCLVFGDADTNATLDASDFGVTSGQATFYYQKGISGSCGKVSRDRDMNAPQYDQQNRCGRCVRIVGPLGSIKVRIVDRCADCAWGNIDLSPLAFSNIAESAEGRVSMIWSYVKC
ncbi:14047_t:CDS:2 [Ambispora leptoticha]|uniref:14047_t:CDS:1 n=1 Tax=Ambispora leptoticha TaxID=144679 RepID=A0A9N9DN00_9GLOM|nr:14047_t:CDS:2 [Ambispora leptoticha]